MAIDPRNRVVSALRLYYLDYPAVILGIASLFFHFSSWKILVTLLLFLGSAFWQSFVGSCYNLFVYLELYYGYLLHFRGCSFTRRPLKEFVPQTLINHLLVERVGIKGTGYELGYVCIVSRKIVGAPWPSAMSSFPLEVLPWYVMVADPAEDLSAHQRFMLLHELGHVALFHRIALERKISVVIQSGFMLAIVALTTSGGSAVLGVIGALVAIWCVLVIVRPTSTLLFEQLADRFALLFLSAKDLEQMSSAAFRVYTQFADDKDREQRQSAFDETLATRRAVTMPDPFIERQDAFNAFALDRLWPHWSAYVFIAAAAAIAAFYSSPGTTVSRIATAIVALLMPTVAYLLVRGLVEFYRRRVELIMENGYVSSEFLFPAYLRWEQRRSGREWN